MPRPRTELQALEALCATACEQHVAGAVSTSANCTDAGVFAAIELAAEHGERPLDLVRADHHHGEDLFPPAELGCELSSECHAAFDEDLAAVGPVRVTPARDPLGAGVAWTLSIAGAMEATSSHAVGQASASITGASRTRGAKVATTQDHARAISGVSNSIAASRCRSHWSATASARPIRCRVCRCHSRSRRSVSPTRAPRGERLYRGCNDVQVDSC